MVTPTQTAPAAQTVPNRRAAYRAPLAGTVTVIVNGRVHDAIAGNVSPQGLRASTNRPLKIGDEVSVAFFVNGALVCARGWVRWCQLTQPGRLAFGVRFGAIEDDGEALLAGYCRGFLS